MKEGLTGKSNDLITLFNLIILIFKVLDLFVGYEECGYLFEFGMEKKRNAEKCIEAIFEKKYYEIFDDPKSKGPYKEKYIFGVSMNAKSADIITRSKVLKLKEDGKLENKNDWKTFC